MQAANCPMTTCYLPHARQGSNYCTVVDSPSGVSLCLCRRSGRWKRANTPTQSREQSRSVDDGWYRGYEGGIKMMRRAVVIVAERPYQRPHGATPAAEVNAKALAIQTPVQKRRRGTTLTSSSQLGTVRPEQPATWPPRSVSRTLAFAMTT
jgi:hypothetical protein